MINVVTESSEAIGDELTSNPIVRKPSFAGWTEAVPCGGMKAFNIGLHTQLDIIHGAIQPRFSPVER